MICLGVDPSSTCTGLALTERERLILTATWKRPSAGSAPQRLFEFEEWLYGWLRGTMPDLAAVEFLSVERNAQSTRVVSHYQAASVIACKRVGLVVVEGRVSTARKMTLGSGSLSKRDAYDRVRAMFPGHGFSHFDRGGGDETDATVMSLAARQLAES